MMYPPLPPAGAALVQSGTCDPYSYTDGGCWGAAPMCSFANICVAIPSYDVDVWVNDWSYWRPPWWLPLRPIFRCDAHDQASMHAFLHLQPGATSCSTCPLVYALFSCFPLSALLQCRPSWWRPPIPLPRPGGWGPIFWPKPPNWGPGKPWPGAWWPGHRCVHVCKIQCHPHSCHMA